MGVRFTVLKNFHSEEFQSDYIEGLAYEARDEDEKLLDLIPKWIKEGKIREGGTEAQMSASGEVEDKK